MGRPRKTATSKTNGQTAGQGHNGPAPLTEEEASALTTHYALKLLAQDRVCAIKKAELDTETTARNALFKRVSADLKFTRKEFQAEVLDKLGMTDAEYLNAEKKRDRLHRLAGLKPGEQIDLLTHVLADTADDAANAEADGYRAGRRADDPELPAHVSSMFTSEWMKGWHLGQEFNGMQLSKAAAILARPAPGTMAPADLDEDEQDDGSPEALKAAAAKLKDNGWVGPTEQEAEFETADNGRTIRAPKAKAQEAAAA